MKHFLPLTLVISFLFSLSAYAQFTPPPPLPPPCGSASDSPPGCLLCLSSYRGTTNRFTGGPRITPFCGDFENTQWLTFVAEANTVTVNIAVANCMNPRDEQGVEMIVTDANLVPVSNCFTSNGNRLSGSVTANTVPQEVYYIAIDGFHGDICTFVLSVTGALNPPPPDPTGPLTPVQNGGPLCPGAEMCYKVDPVANANQYQWTVPANGTILSQNDNQICIRWNSPGAGLLIVTPSNPCYPGTPAILPIVVASVPPTIYAPMLVCQEDFPYSFDNRTFPGPGNYRFTEKTKFFGCDSVVNYTFILIPTVPTIFPPILACQTEFPLTFDNRVFPRTGNYQFIEESSMGCDSIIRYTIIPRNAAPGVLDTTICQGTCLEYYGNQYCDVGVFDVPLPIQAANGCDSIVRLTVSKLNPVADISPPPQISCAPGSTVTLNATNSSSGAGVTYSWTARNGGVLVPPTTQNTQVVSAAGTYIIAVTQMANNQTCTVRDTVIVSQQNIPVASPTFTTADTSLCEGEIGTYTINPVTDATSYTWTVPVGATLNGSGTSVTVDWANTGGGPICVTAHGPCGDSPPSCLSVKVDPNPTADFTMPAVICQTNSATIVHTGTADPASVFTWTLSGGTPANISGPGPHQISWASGGQKTVTLSITDPNGCISTTVSHTIQVDAPLTPPVINCNSTVNSITFSWNAVPNANNYDITINNVPAGNQTATTYTVSNLNPNDQVTIIVVANGNTSCGTSTATTTCVAQDCPGVALNIQPVNDICRDANPGVINLAANPTGGAGGGTLVWSGPGTTSGGIFNPTTANLGINVISLTYTEGTCPYTESIVINVYEAPSSTFNAESPICLTETSTVTYIGSGTSSSTYNWNFNGGTIVSGSGAGPYEISWPSPGTYTVSLQATENGCTSSPVTRNVVVDNQLAPPVVVCDVTTTSITFSWGNVPGAVSYNVNLLSGPPGIFDANANTYTVSNIGTGVEVEIEVVANGSPSCDPSRTTITCESGACPSDVLVIQPVAPICKVNASAIQLVASMNSGNNAGTFVFSGPGTTPDGVFDASLPSVNPGTITINATYTIDNCVYDGSLNITVNPQPSANFTVDDRICEKGSSTVQALNTNPGVVYTWDFGGGTPANVQGPGPHEISWADEGIKNITLSVSENNCPSAPRTLSVTVDPELELPVIDCEALQNSVIFSWNPIAHVTGYTVNLLSGPAGVFDNSNRTYTVNNLNSGDEVTIELVANTNSLCGPVSVTQTCQPFTCPTDFAIMCDQNETSIVFSWDAVPTAIDYTVNVVSGPTGVLDNFNRTYTITNLSPGDQVTIEVTAIFNSVCAPLTVSQTCSASECPDNIMVTLKQQERICLDGLTGNIDLRDSILVTGGSSNPSITWSGGNYITLAGTFFPTQAGPGRHRVVVNYEDPAQSGCIITASMDIDLVALPAASIDVPPQICVSDQVIVGANGADVGDVFDWDFGSATVLSGSGEGPYELSWAQGGFVDTIKLVVNNMGCFGPFQMATIQIDPLLATPNINCDAGNQFVHFSWDLVPGATDYDVVVLNGPGAPTSQTQTSANFDNLNPLDEITIELTVSNANSACPPVTVTQTCAARACPPTQVIIDRILDTCLVSGNLPNINLSAQVLNDPGNGAGTFTWQVNGNPSNGIFSPAQAGQYNIHLTYEFDGCSFEADRMVNFFATPVAAISADNRICLNASNAISFSGTAPTGATYTWNFDGGTPAAVTGPGPHQISWTTAGTKRITVVASANGCTSAQGTFDVLIDQPLGTPVINCDNAAITTTSTGFAWAAVAGADRYEVFINGTSRGIQTTTSFTENNLTPDQAVNIRVVAIPPAGSECPPTEATLTCRSNPCPAIVLQIDPVDPICLNEAVNQTLVLNAVNSNGTGVATWSGPGVSGGGVFNPIAAGVGTHTIRCNFSEQSCDYSASIEIVVNEPPVADAGADQEITCFDNITQIGGAGTSQDCPCLEYTWTLNGNTVSNQLFPTVVGDGTYTLRVFNSETGCSDTDDVDVVSIITSPDLDASLRQISCFGRNDGNIVVNGVNGGTPPFVYSMNGANFTGQNNFRNLGPGVYNLRVQDSNGCEDEITFEIIEPDELTVELKVYLPGYPDAELTLGDSVQLEALTNYAPELLSSVNWTPVAQIPNCDEVNISNCMSIFVTPTGQTIYTVRIENVNGCAAEDRANISVKPATRPVYIPNVFSPNKDLNNDLFRVYGDPRLVTKIKSFLVFDRWGEIMYEAYNFDPCIDDATCPIGWDGFFRGEKMNSGVFVYYAEIEFLDGVVEIFKGDVFLK